MFLIVVIIVGFVLFRLKNLMRLRKKMNIYVGNLSFSTSEENIRSHFEQFGKVDSAKIIKDRETGNSRGFAFVEMPNNSEAQNAINNLNGKEFEGRRLVVNESRPRSDRPQGGDRRRREKRNF